MITPLLALVGFAQASPNVTVAFTGIPELNSNQNGLEVRTHSATITIRDGFAEGTSVTEIRNGADQVAMVSIGIPELGIAMNEERPRIRVKATWSGQDLPLRRAEDGTGSASATRTMPPRSTAALRTAFRVPLGIAGRNGLQRAVAYQLKANQPIGQLNVAIKYTEKEVFRLPEIEPSTGWQIGARGAFLRRTNLRPIHELVIAKFYPGGFGE